MPNIPNQTNIHQQVGVARRVEQENKPEQVKWIPLESHQATDVKLATKQNATMQNIEFAYNFSKFPQESPAQEDAQAGDATRKTSS